MAEGKLLDCLQVFRVVFKDCEHVGEKGAEFWLGRV